MTRVNWKPESWGFIAATQDGEITVKLLNHRHYWEVKVNGEQRRIAPSAQAAKRYGKEFLK